MPAMQRPNVLLVTTDQQQFDTLLAAGNEHMHTPNLDALAASGTMFSHACCNSPACMPSRQSFMSGQQPWALNRTANGQEMPEDVPCVQHLLGGIGYHTAQIGKLHFTNIQPRDRGEIHPRYGFDTMILAEHNAPGFRDPYDLWVDERHPGAARKARDLGAEAYWDAERYQHPYEQFNASMPLVFQADESLTLSLSPIPIAPIAPHRASGGPNRAGNPSLATSRWGGARREGGSSGRSRFHQHATHLSLVRLSPI
jgi:arylsulfatase A-like enzyme